MKLTDHTMTKVGESDPEETTRKSFRKLGEYLNNIIYRQFQEAKMEELANITDVDPVFTPSQFAKG